MTGDFEFAPLLALSVSYSRPIYLVYINDLLGLKREIRNAAMLLQILQMKRTGNNKQHFCKCVWRTGSFLSCHRMSNQNCPVCQIERRAQTHTRTQIFIFCVHLRHWCQHPSPLLHLALHTRLLTQRGRQGGKCYKYVLYIQQKTESYRCPAV